MQLTALLTQLSSSQPMFKTSEHTSLRHTITVAYLGGGTVRCPLGSTMKIFYRRLYMKKCVFCHFLQELQNSTMFDGLLRFQISEKMGKFAVSIEHSNRKSVSASGGLCPPDLPTRGSAPGPRWGLRPQTSVIGSCSVLRALAMAPPLPNPKYATVQ